MSSYYYLMAQLPGILPNLPLPVTYDQFKETASRFISARDNKILAALSLEPPRPEHKTGSVLVDSWYERERILRLCLERLRAARFKRDVHWTQEEEESVLKYPDIQQAAKNVSGLESPLDAERALENIRRSWVESLRGNHFFDSEALFAYAISLLLHERGDRFTKEAGRASYTSIYNQILGEEA